MKTEFESRISFHPIKLQGKRVFQANVYWKGKSYEVIKLTKELCIEELKYQAKAD